MTDDFSRGGQAETATPPDRRPDPTQEELLLQPYQGQRPPAPGWFTRAVETPFRTRTITVEGTDIVYQQWGDAAKPGLLLVHGNGAHAGWFDFIAPFLAEDWNVVAANFSGMGDSGWREAYTFSGFCAEQIAVCEDAGLFDHAQKPVIVAHSFGGLVSLLTAIEHGDRFAGAIIVDSHIEPPGEDRPRPPRRTRPNRVYPDLASALARFRLAPPQPCENDFAVDYIARHSLKETQDEDGRPGLVWKFDPFIFSKLLAEWDTMDLTRLETKCPILFMRGAESSLVTPEVAAYMASLQDPPVPTVSIPQAHHHIMLDQPLAFVAAIRGILTGWPGGR
ncbi:alpha/beta fold hydrolase [Henriciella aquimarina]|uniref:alpha/beta fold hydrolase n=1 Tax=Henriciella aquimarina TaxID=545261 RepID=UPI0009FD3248|nr:alpha/beta hydrolase [Henriciella aquimarina]